MRFTRRIVTPLIAAALAPGAARADEIVSILTGSTAGAYYPLGVALARILARRPGLAPSVQATRGSVENLMLLQQGRGEFGFALGDALAQGFAGAEEAGFRGRLDKLRAVAALYPNYVQIVAARRAGIRSLADLRGKRLAVGPRRSAAELNARAILAAAGLGYADLGKVEYVGFGESAELVKARGLDAMLLSAGLGVPALRDLAAAVEVAVVEIPPAVIDKAGPPFARAVIPADSYAGQTVPVATASIANCLVTRADLSDDLAYAAAQALFENLPELAAAHPAAADIRLERATEGLPVPLHAGAARYLKEKGVGE